MTIVVGSVCTGIAADARAVIEAGLDWRHAYFSEIARFPSRVLAHHYPEVPNLGDFTKIDASAHRIDLLVGGTPCQDFSVAGLRRGLAGASGNLALEFLRLAARARPTWICWENVPGVLSQDKGRAFGAFLGGLEELGYGWAYRTYDAQFFNVAQRRARVFVVGCARGQWQRAGAVLLERSGLRWDPAPSREAREEVAGTLEARAGRGGPGPDAHGAASGYLQVAGALKSTSGKSGVGLDGAAGGHLVAGTIRTQDRRADVDGAASGCLVVANTITTREGQRQEPSAETYVLPIQDPRGRRKQGGSGIGTHGAPSYTLEQHPAAVAVIPFDTTQITHAENRSRCEPGSPSPSLARGAHPPAFAFHQTQDPIHGDISPALGRKSMGMGMGSTIRRLTPRECERLQSFPDDYTAITWKTKKGKVKHAEDSPRYAALGNAINVKVLARIFRNIDQVHRIGDQS